MFRFPTFPTAVVACVLALPGCSPVFNWREVRPEGTRLTVLLPCKPDRAQKVVPLGGQATTLSMLGCDAGGATFAVAVADVGDAARAAPVLAQWQEAAWMNMKAVPASRQPLPLRIAGAPAGLNATRVQAQGQRADGTPVSGQAAYFAQGSQLFQAVLYAPQIDPDAAETFFSSLKFD